MRKDVRFLQPVFKLAKLQRDDGNVLLFRNPWNGFPNPWGGRAPATGNESAAFPRLHSLLVEVRA